MATSKLTPQELQQIHDGAAQWGKIVARRAFGDDGPGLDTDLTTLEQVAAAAARGLTEGTLTTLLEQQAQSLPAEQPCPDCGHLCPVHHELRQLTGAGGTFSYREPLGHCPACRRDFFPLRPALQLDGHSYTPDLQRRILTLAGRLKSFDLVGVALQVAADVSISGRHVQRLTQEVGTDLARQRDEQAALYRRRELPSRGAERVPLAVVETDGGRLGTRQAGAGPGVHQAQAKEDKIACLVSMCSDTHDVDPQPEPPPAFRDCRRVARLVQQFQGQTTAAEDTVDTAPPDDATPLTEAADRPPPPQRLLRTCVATLHNSRAFGPLVAAEAQVRGFYDAPRQAFLGDGQQYNWTIQRTWFPHFVPIADFLHVLCYLYRAGQVVGTDAATRWQQYEHWLTACWQGRVTTVLAELTACQERLGRPPPAAERSADDAWSVLAEVAGYLSNNQSRMDYPRYRQQGLPVTSSWVESLVGEFNSRVKGRDKYWNRSSGAEAILQVRAAVLSEDERLARYFAERPGNPYRRR